MVYNSRKRTEMNDYIKSSINYAFTESEKEAVLFQVAVLLGSGSTMEFYREERNGKNVLMVRQKNQYRTASREVCDF
jgi:hypothetical protein